MTISTPNRLFSNFSLEEKAGGKLAAALERTSQPESMMGGSTSEPGEGLGILQAVEEHNAQKQQSLARTTTIGGSLDRVADNAAQAVSGAAKSWTTWITRR